MARRGPVAVIALLAGCGGDPSEAATAWETASSEDDGGADPSGGEPSTSAGETADTAVDDHGELGSTAAADDTVGDGESSSSSGGGGYECTPWATQWIGGPCTGDAECSYDGGVCLREDEGFPCGTCSQPCDELCPDLDGAPETFCIDGADVGIAATGFCISQCDPGILGGNGCRDGYTCAALERYNDPGITTGVCVPQGMADPMTDCQQDLVDRGIAFVPTTHELDHPEGHPELDCVIIDPVLLYGPVEGVGLVDGNGDDNPVLVACETAIAIADTAVIAASKDPATIEIMHYGTYNCRVIAGTDSLSNHAEGRAIDLAAFTFAGGEQYSVYADWEDGVASPVTPAGQWLRSFTDELWDTSTWHIILTPEYNADHNDHFHVDLTPGDMFYE
jgi:Extensin-like protein C-terminus